jgi:hypothetical protein
LTAYAKPRRKALRLLPVRSTVRSIKLYHRQVYHYAYHRPKLALLREGTRTNKPIAQLTLYVLALSQLTGIRLFDIKCA